MPVIFFHEMGVNYLSFEFRPNRLENVVTPIILLKVVKNTSFPNVLWAAPPFENQLLSTLYHFEASESSLNGKICKNFTSKTLDGIVLRA